MSSAEDEEEANSNGVREEVANNSHNAREEEADDSNRMEEQANDSNRIGEEANSIRMEEETDNHCYNVDAILVLLTRRLKYVRNKCLTF